MWPSTWSSLSVSHIYPWLHTTYSEISLVSSSLDFRCIWNPAGGLSISHLKVCDVLTYVKGPVTILGFLANPETLHSHGRSNPRMMLNKASLMPRVWLSPNADQPIISILSRMPYLGSEKHLRIVICGQLKTLNSNNTWQIVQSKIARGKSYFDPCNSRFSHPQNSNQLVLGISSPAEPMFYSQHFLSYFLS